MTRLLPDGFRTCINFITSFITQVTSTRCTFAVYLSLAQHLICHLDEHFQTKPVFTILSIVA